jgi:hypothetical protein
LARSLHAGTGDLVTLDTPHGPQRVRIVGTVTEYAGGGSALSLDRAAANRLFGPVGVHAFLVTSRIDQRDLAYTALVWFCGTRGLLPQKNEDVRRTVNDLTRALTAALWWGGNRVRGIGPNAGYRSVSCWPSLSGMAGRCWAASSSPKGGPPTPFAARKPASRPRCGW